MRSDPEVMKYIGDGSIQTKEEVENFIKCSLTGGYYEKYGLDFFSVYEKETGAFVGQAGLFHVGFNVKQSDIELAYRLHTKYWNRGYATELAKALMENPYGFNKLSLPKIIAAIRPENERSRRVLVKPECHTLALLISMEAHGHVTRFIIRKLDVSKVK